MKHLYNTTTTLQTDSKVRVEANYNRTIHGMTKPGQVLFYKAPQDPAEHPMYVDAEGRNVPVSPTTLQPMKNAAGNLLDKNGVLLPVYDIKGVLPHIDDVRIAVTSSDFDVKDQDGKDIYISHDGVIIPTNDDGVPNTTTVDGKTWVLGVNGQPHAPLERVFTLSSYVRPVRAENVPVRKNGSLAPKVEDEYPEYFDINSIIKADRPAKRGALIAWTATDTFDNAVSSGLHGYKGARFYAADKDMQYKYWTSSTSSDANSTPTGSTVAVFDSSWRLNGGTGRVDGTNLISADFPGNGSATSSAYYFEKVLSLNSGLSYELDFTVMPQSMASLRVELVEWTDDQPTNANHNSASRLRPTVLINRTVYGGMSRKFNIDVTPSANTKTHAIRFTVLRAGAVQPKVTFSNLSLRPTTYAISGVGPRAVYDRPVDVNKIVIGVDYSADETILGRGSSSNLPSDAAIRVYRDRGDGQFTWVTAVTNPEIDEDGKATVYFDGSAWGDEAQYGPTQQIMGVQYAVYGMKRRDARINIMEISARRTYDVSDMLLSYSVDSEVSDDSFVLPFGTVNSNSGNLELSNHDGRFNSDNRYLLDRARSTQDKPVFTTTPNPFYQMLNESVYVEIDTATYEPGSADRQYLRMITAQSGSNIAPGNSMDVSVPLRDDARVLESITPAQTFYSGPTMSVIQVLYMLLDSVGFTNVVFSDEDEHFSSHVGYFWTDDKGDNIWAVIEDVCRSTQTVAFFDEFNVLHFKSLKGMYIDALAKSPAQVFTTEDLPGILANVKDMSLEDKVSVNKVNVNYREISEHEKSASGVQPNEVVWEPEGTVVLRAAYLTEGLNNQQVNPKGSMYMYLAPGSTKTWQFSGMVQVEGEFIKYDGKEYKYHLSNGRTQVKVIYNEDERKKLDENNEYLALKNTYTGRLRITERGAEGTAIKAHSVDPLSSFTRRRRVGTLATQNFYNQGLSVKNSRLFINAVPNPGDATVSVSDGNVVDNKPHHLGTRFRINNGGFAGMCFGLSSPHDDGIYVEVGSTEVTEAQGRPRGELHFYTKINGQYKYWGFGIDVPISRYKDYDLDVSIRDGHHMLTQNSYQQHYEVSLKYGDKGAPVTVLQTALNLHNERLATDGSFGTSTRDAVKRLQRRRGLAEDGVVNIEEWKALETGQYNVTVLSISATIDGTYTANIQIPKNQLPGGWNGGRFGVFTRASTNASFEYMYAMRGGEDIEFDNSNFYDYIKGGYVSDQLDAGWIYQTGLKKIGNSQRRVITNQLYMNDFGAFAHEVRDFDVVFNSDSPALSSFPYFSNESHVHLTDYMHKPFGAKMRLANKARHDAILNGEDSVTFGSENSVDQKFMIYGNTLKIEDQRSVTVSNETAISSRGAEELSIDVDWVQSKQSAEKLGSHIVEAMSHPVPTYSMDVFGHSAIRVGQIVSIYNPQLGVGGVTDPENANRFFVYGAKQNNDGKAATTITVRQVIGGGGKRQSALNDVLARNNNAMNVNPNIEAYEKVGGVYVPTGYSARAGVRLAFKAPVQLTANGGGAAELAGTDGSARNSSILAKPYPEGTGRFAHNYGHYYLATASVSAPVAVAVGLVIEGRATSDGAVTELASTTLVLKAGETKRITLKGQFLSNAELPELDVAVQILDHKNTSIGARMNGRLYVNDLFYRSSQSPDDIYPIVGGDALRKL